MNDRMKAVCDGCKQEFTIKKMNTKYHKYGIQEVWFKCSGCNKRYTCFYTDGAIRNMQQEMRKLTSTRPKNNSHEMMLSKAIKEKKESIAIAMEELKIKMQSKELN